MTADALQNRLAQELDRYGIDRPEAKWLGAGALELLDISSVPN